MRAPPGSTTGELVENSGSKMKLNGDLLSYFRIANNTRSKMSYFLICPICFSLVVSSGRESGANFARIFLKFLAIASESGVFS